MYIFREMARSLAINRELGGRSMFNYLFTDSYLKLFSFNRWAVDLVAMEW